MAGVDIDTIVTKLSMRLGRLPTEDEVIAFLFGDLETQTKIWNQKKEKSNG